MLLWCGMGPHLYGKFYAIFPTAECMGLLHGVVWVLVISVPRIPVLHISSGASWINCFSTRETEEKFLRAGPGRLLGSLLTMDLIVSRELFHPSVLFDAWVHHSYGLGQKNNDSWKMTPHTGFYLLKVDFQLLQFDVKFDTYLAAKYHQIFPFFFFDKINARR